jgi:cystathionine beta-synthase
VFNDEWMRENQMLEPERVTLGQLLDGKQGVAPTGVVSIGPGAAVRQALRLMSQHDVSQLPVMDGGSCVGAVSESALSLSALENVKVLDRTVGDVMDSPFPTVDAGHPVDGIAKLLSKSNSAVLVREDGATRGIVTRSDIVHFLMSR